MITMLYVFIMNAKKYLVVLRLGYRALRNECFSENKYIFVVYVSKLDESYETHTFHDLLLFIMLKFWAR
jgi:hypothetical protein